MSVVGLGQYIHESIHFPGGRTGRSAVSAAASPSPCRRSARRRRLRRRRRRAGPSPRRARETTTGRRDSTSRPPSRPWRMGSVGSSSRSRRRRLCCPRGISGRIQLNSRPPSREERTAVAVSRRRREVRREERERALTAIECLNVCLHRMWLGYSRRSGLFGKSALSSPRWRNGRPLLFWPLFHGGVHKGGWDGAPLSI